MKITVMDTPRAMLEILARPLSERAEELRRLVAAMYEHVPMPGDPVDLHHQGGGFRVDTDDPRYVPALERLVTDDVVGQITVALEQASAALGEWKQPDEVKVLFMLGNPDDEHLMKVTGGYYGMGGAPGWLYLIGWPSDDVIGRIAYCAVHELHHQIRYQNVPWVPMVGEHVVSEGLAEAFVREVFGPAAMGPWSTMVSGSPLDAAYAKTIAAFDLTGYDKTAAYVLGDTTAQKFGSEPVGIPDMAGYAVGLRIVDAHLAATGLTVAQSTGLTGSEILARAT
ncbi:MAG: peptidase [Hamadaea sp.]|uniref:DUF2268 domain-containing protein n=1 Tax=Hamadaea sp. TaxID=2024425 RepID=UPI00181978A5|nr:DUF2268 domain-containing putative Zn-dependent protease [Hamadaea sp.]NUT20816.1 peptidase [Hamadaea sp.]